MGKHSRKGDEIFNFNFRIFSAISNYAYILSEIA